MSKTTCDQDVFERGDFVGLYNITKDQAEAMCERLTEQTGDKHDWHYVAGRVRVLRLPREESIACTCHTSNSMGEIVQEAIDKDIIEKVHQGAIRRNIEYVELLKKREQEIADLEFEVEKLEDQVQKLRSELADAVWGGNDGWG